MLAGCGDAPHAARIEAALRTFRAVPMLNDALAGGGRAALSGTACAGRYTAQNHRCDDCNVHTIARPHAVAAGSRFRILGGRIWLATRVIGEVSAMPLCAAAPICHQANRLAKPGPRGQSAGERCRSRSGCASSQPADTPQLNFGSSSCRLLKPDTFARYRHGFSAPGKAVRSKSSALRPETG